MVFSHMQLVFDVCVMFVVISCFFISLCRSCFLNRLWAFMEKRKAAIDADKDEAAAELEAADKLKAEYDELLKAAHKEAEGNFIRFL